MAPLTQFFTNLIGRSIYGEVNTGQLSFVETYARTYSATVLYLTGDDQVEVHVTSRDLCPSGAPESGSHRCFGDHGISLAGCTGLTEFWQAGRCGGRPCLRQGLPWCQRSQAGVKDTLRIEKAGPTSPPFRVQASAVLRH